MQATQASAFETVRQRQNAYVVRNGGLHMIHEGDETYNEYNRMLIDAYKKLYGTVYLGNFNLYGDRRQKVLEGQESPLVEYVGQDIENFSYDFIIPRKDKAIEDAVRRWNLRMSMKDQRVLFARIESLGGVILIWS